MRRRNPETIRRLMVAAGDWLLVVGCCYLAYWVRFVSGWIAAPKGTPEAADFAGITVLAACLWLWAFHWAGVYAGRHTASATDEVYEVLVGIVVGSLAVGAVSFLIQAFWYSRLVSGLTAAFAAVVLPAWHLGMRAVADRLSRQGLGCQRIAVVGANVTGSTVAQKARELGPSHEVVGLLAVSEEESAKPSQGPVLGSLSELGDVVRKHEIHELWVPPSAVSPATGLQLVAEAERVGARVKFLPDLLDLLKHRGELQTLGGVQLLSVRYARIAGVHRVLKRAVDFVGSAALLLLLAPSMLVLAGLIRLTSRGPALYVQERVGLKGRPFNMLKFRTMRLDAEVETGPVWATDSDPRRTPMGAFLRRTSLDELPQLINVLLGQMSLVGPRPERPHFVAQFRERLPRYDERHRVKGGLTGWAQVHGMRGNSSIMGRTLYDLYYVENWSLELDLEILVKTAFEVLFHRTAY